MDIQAEKIALVKMVLDIDNPDILKSIKKILNNNKNIDFWDKLSVEQQQEINNASQELTDGKYTDYKSFIEKHR